MSNFSFQQGFSQVMQKDVANVRAEIMTALDITTRSSWAARLNGTVEPKVSEAQQIEAIFAKYGIKDVWGAEV